MAVAALLAALTLAAALVSGRSSFLCQCAFSQTLFDKLQLAAIKNWQIRLGEHYVTPTCAGSIDSKGF